MINQFLGFRGKEVTKIKLNIINAYIIFLNFKAYAVKIVLFTLETALNMCGSKQIDLHIFVMTPMKS